MMDSNKFGMVLAATVFVVGVAACSSVPKPNAEIAAAKTSLDIAAQAGASADAGAVFAQARDLLQSAEASVEQEEFAKAKRLAEMAKAKAEQAQAEAELARTEASAAEIESSLSSLREALRN
ncbi:MAG: DUF4398 domain-containing protein [Burkholderiaceae bacterium]